MRLRLYSFIIRIVLACILTVLGVCILIGVTPQGSRWLVQEIAELSQGEFSYQSFSGTLLHQFAFEHFNFQNKKHSIQITHLQLQWDPIKLFTSTLSIQTLNLIGTRWEVFDTPEENSTISLPQWFSSVEINQFQCRQCYFHRKKFELQIDHIDLDFFARNFDSFKKITLQLNLKTLVGKLQGKNLVGQGKIQGDPEGILWNHWEVRLGQAFMRMNGALGQQLSLAWEIRIPNLSDLIPGVQGKIYSQGNLPNHAIQMVVKQAAENVVLNVTGSFRNKIWTANFKGSIENITGTGNIQLALLEWQKNRVKILATLAHGYLEYSPSNLILKNISLRLEGWSDGVLNITGSLNSDTGQLNISGEIQQIFSNLWVRLKLVGQNLLVSNSENYRLWASSNLTLNYQNDTVSVNGSILIPKGSIDFADIDSAPKLTSDIVYEDQSQRHFNFLANILLTVNDLVTLRYDGLTGNLRGEVQLHQPQDGPATAVGKLHLKNGQYKAYGQTLNIQKAEALYKGGEVSNPFLNIQAVKILKNIAPTTLDGAIVSGENWVNPEGTLTVGVSVTGPLLQHQIQLFSDPAGLSQSDILSYMILGVPASQAGSGGGQLLLSAASMLGDGSQGNTITQLQSQLKNTLGIEVGVSNVSQYNPSTQSVTQGTALFLTKTLSPKLFLTYSAGLGQAVSTFKVRYQITPSWMAQTESSILGNGGDLYYTIDRN